MIAVVAAACTGGTEADNVEPDATTTIAAGSDPTTTTTPSVFGFERNDGDGRLVFGGLFVEPDATSGAGASAQAAARIAVAEIQAAGGVLLEEVFYVPGVAGADDVNQTQQSVDRLLNDTVDVILDGAPAAQSLELLAKTADAGVMQFSPINSDAEFSSADGTELYFRTVPSVSEQATVVADLLTEQSLPTATVLFVDGDVGMSMADAFRQQFESLGGEVVQQLPFDAGTADFAASVDIAAQSSPNAVVVIGGEELGPLLLAMDTSGIGPRATQVFALPTEDVDLATLVTDPAVLNGLVRVDAAINPEATGVFNEQIQAQGVEEPDISAAVATYDAIIISALAAEIAGTDRPEAIAEQVIGVTREGVLCVRFDECKELVQAGDDINYDSPLGGPYEFVPPGEPSAASFRVVTYDGAAIPNAELDRYVFAR